MCNAKYDRTNQDAARRVTLPVLDFMPGGHDLRRTGSRLLLIASGKSIRRTREDRLRPSIANFVALVLLGAIATPESLFEADILML